MGIGRDHPCTGAHQFEERLEQMRVGVEKRREERAEGRETRVPDVRSGALHASAAARPRAYETPGDPQNRKPRIGREGGEDTRPTGRWAPGGVPTSSAMHTAYSALGQDLVGQAKISHHD